MRRQLSAISFQRLAFSQDKRLTRYFKFLPLYFLCIATVYLLCFVFPLAAQETTPDPFADAVRGTVTGSIANGTAAATVPPDQQISLIISSEGVALQQMDTTASPDGSFAFPDVPILAGANYVAAVIYRDRVFSSAFATGDPAVTTIDLPITIYEPTEDPSVVSITGTVIQISAVGETLEVRQVIRFQNTSDRIFTSSGDLGSGRFASLIVPLPPGAQIISFDDPQRYVVSQEDFTVVDTAPVFPSDNHLVVVVYILPYDGSPALIEQPMNYLFNGQVRLLTWPDSVTVKSDQLPDLGRETLGDREYRAFGAPISLNPGDVIRYELSGAAAESDSASSANTTGSALPLLIGIVLAAAGAFGLLLVLRNRRPAPTPQQQIDALLRQIALLDQQHQSGQLAHDVWHRLRAPLKAQLDKLMDEDEA